VARFLLDANVLSSAAIRPGGPPGEIVALFLAQSAFDLVISYAIVAEAEAGLRLPKIRKYLRDPSQALAWLADLLALAELVQDTGRVKGICRDPADDMILSAAIEGRADTIVTGDEDLLTLGEHAGIAIITPRAFVERMRR